MQITPEIIILITQHNANCKNIASSIFGELKVNVLCCIIHFGVISVEEYCILNRSLVTKIIDAISFENVHITNI